MITISREYDGRWNAAGNFIRGGAANEQVVTSGPIQSGAAVIDRIRVVAAGGGTFDSGVLAAKIMGW